jgi:hypothetical protein
VANELIVCISKPRVEAESRLFLAFRSCLISEPQGVSSLKPIITLSLLLLFSIPAYSQKAFDGCQAVGRGKQTAKNPTGTLSAGKQELNKLKNRDNAPATITNSVTLDKIMKPGNDGIFKPSQGVAVVGYVAHVKAGEPRETCNCARDDIADIHIDVVLKESDKNKSSKYMIVEISPRWQVKLGDLASVKSKLEGSWVRFTGWMLYDYIHKSNAKNTNPKGKAIWRATAWEVHPVTAFKVVPAP